VARMDERSVSWWPSLTKPALLTRTTVAGINRLLLASHCLWLHLGRT
jgi:hypothetical protein